MHLVPPKPKPKHDRAVCPECGIPTLGIMFYACPEINVKTGKFKRKGSLQILYCTECYRKGVYSELARV